MEMREALDQFSTEQTDVLGYFGLIDKNGYEELCAILEGLGAERKKQVLLYLCTGGGNPNAGYRIARALIHHYGADNFRVAIPAECKSAGTLICIGASSLIMCDQGELGRLDIQFQKQDEIFQQSSGLDILRGMTYLQGEALSTFNKYLLDINGGSGLSTKVASEIASRLVMGMYEPMYSQIDPIRLGEMNAALQIAHEYGTRLGEKSKSLKPNALSKLINDYPAHGFVIDRAEARTLFNSIVSPKPHEKILATLARDVLWRKSQNSASSVLDLNKFLAPFFPKVNVNATQDINPTSDSIDKPDAVASDGNKESGQLAPGDAAQRPSDEG